MEFHVMAEKAKSLSQRKILSQSVGRIQFSQLQGMVLFKETVS